jgi:ketopantoate reductase
METIMTDRFQDAVHSKLIINLTGALTTLLGNKLQEIPEQALVQKLFMKLLLEGVMVVKMAGYKEYKINGMPSWNKIRRTAKLPQFMTRRKFKAHMQKMGMSSMTQDIIQRGKHDSELESLNGYFMELAEQYGFRVPYNRTIYQLCQAEFAEHEFTPMDVVEVWEKVKEKLKK